MPLRVSLVSWSETRTTDHERDAPQVRAGYLGIVRPAIATTTVFVVYSVAMLAWVWFILSAAQLEADVFPRFLRITNNWSWLTLAGTGWTVLLVVTVVLALRARGRLTVASLATATVVAIAVTGLLPTWFRDVGYFGSSTGEFLDATFLLLGGALGGNAGIGLLLTCGVLIGLTFLTAARYLNSRQP